MTMQTPEGVRALTFDVFGTVVDWRGSIIDEGGALNARKGLEVDWAAFADAWRARYGPSMDRVRRGDLPWTNLDDLHRMSLDALVPEFGLQAMSEAERVALNHVWHRLRPWPDSVPGLTRLRTRYTIATLSNGNVALLREMASAAGLPWHQILSAEQAHAYKPDPVVYQTAVQTLGLHAQNVMMVAAHPGDLRAAKAIGMQSALVPRPYEYGPGHEAEVYDPSEFALVTRDFVELAARLGT